MAGNTKVGEARVWRVEPRCPAAALEDTTELSAPFNRMEGYAVTHREAGIH